MNCRFDPSTAVESIKIMKGAIEEEGLSGLYYMTQPVGFRTYGATKSGLSELPENPLGIAAFYSNLMSDTFCT